MLSRDWTDNMLIPISLPWFEGSLYTVYNLLRPPNHYQVTGKPPTIYSQLSNVFPMIGKTICWFHFLCHLLRDYYTQYTFSWGLLITTKLLETQQSPICNPAISFRCLERQYADSNFLPTFWGIIIHSIQSAEIPLTTIESLEPSQAPVDNLHIYFWWYPETGQTICSLKCPCQFSSDHYTQYSICWDLPTTIESMEAHNYLSRTKIFISILYSRCI